MFLILCLKVKVIRLFCAGGDIVKIYQSVKSSPSQTLHKDFFAEEYILDYLIGTLKTPHISFLDGVTMGGGVGLSVHGQFRIATENTLFAMPETGIGFFPDVGGSYFLPRLPGSLGTYLALTGYRLKGEDVVTAGVATHYVPSHLLPALELQLSKINSKNPELVNRTILQFAKTIDRDISNIITHKKLIDQIFSLESVEAILTALSQNKSEFATETINTLLKMSPTSLKVTLRQMKEGKKLDFKSCLIMEYKLSQAFMENNDFCEGVRAQLVDKDRQPKWSPPKLEEVTQTLVDSYFKNSSTLTLPEHTLSKV